MSDKELKEINKTLKDISGHLKKIAANQDRQIRTNGLTTNPEGEGERDSFITKCY